MFETIPGSHLFRYERVWTVRTASLGFHVYWGIAAVLLAIVTNLLWVRGMDTSWRNRLKLAREAFHGPDCRQLCRVHSAPGWSAPFIYYNTHVVESLPDNVRRSRKHVRSTKRNTRISKRSCSRG